MAERRLRFFVVGDIGEPGPERARVADAMGALLKEHQVSFVLTTGDNSYKTAGFDDAAFERLERDMLQKVPLPWLFTLGNHDVKPAGWDWHRTRHGATSHGAGADGGGWSWHCPAPAYTHRA